MLNVKKQLNLILLFLIVFCVGFPFNHAFGGLYYNRMVPSVPHSNSDGHYSFELPPAWDEISKSSLDKIASQDKTGSIEYVDGFQLIRNEYPYMLVQEYKVNTPSYSQLEKTFKNYNLQNKLDEKSAEYKELISVGTAEKPFIDKERNIIFMNIQADVTNVGQVNALMAMFLGKNGITQFNFYSKKDEYSMWLPAFNSIINTFKYDDGFQYNSDVAKKNDEIPLSDGVVDKAVNGMIVGFGLGLLSFIIIGIRSIFNILRGKSNNSK